MTVAQRPHFRRTFLVVCMEGIVVVDGWENARDHRAFGERMGAHLQAVGMGKPDGLEHLRIARLGWGPAPVEAS